MKITRRQLKQIISESLGVQVLQEVNFKRIRRDLFKLQDDIDNQQLLDKVFKHAEDLKTKVDAGETGFLKGRYREAVTLLNDLEAVLNAPTPAAVKKAVKSVDNLPKDKPETKPENKDDKDKWNPDPDKKGIWEYQLRDCTWYARMVKKPEKEFKLGKSKQTWGKYKDSIKILDKAFPNLIKDCGVPNKPKPKPGDKEGGGGGPLTDLYNEIRGELRSSGVGGKFKRFESEINSDGRNPASDLLSGLKGYSRMEKEKTGKGASDARNRILSILNVEKANANQLAMKYPVLTSLGDDYGADQFVAIYDMAVEQLYNILLDDYVKSDEQWKQNVGNGGISNRFAKEKLSQKTFRIVQESLSRGSLLRKRYRRY